MILAINIGNTNIVLSRHENGSWTERKRVKTNDSHAIEEISSILGTCRPNHAVICSVVPNLTWSVVEAVRRCCLCEPYVVGKHGKTGLYPETVPEELGDDLLCNMIAAHSLYPGRYVTVADFGTAFTTSTVSPDGRILGVTIAPGLMTSVKALFTNTALLPEIRLDIPDTVMGRDTVSAIRAGVIYGFTGQLDAIIKQIEKEIHNTTFIVATGGFSQFIRQFVNRVDVTDINFTLEGARIACLMNS